MTFLQNLLFFIFEISALGAFERSVRFASIMSISKDRNRAARNF